MFLLERNTLTDLIFLKIDFFGFFRVSVRQTGNGGERGGDMQHD